MANLGYLWRHRAKFPMISKSFYRAWGKRMFSFPKLMISNRQRTLLTRKGAKIDNTAEIGKVTVEGRKRLLTIGAFSFLGRVKIALHDEVKIGERVCINDGVDILTASHDVLDPKWQHIKGKVEIEDYVWIGTGAMILPGVTLGRGCVVGARAVVSKSVEPGTIVVGNPAKIVSKKRVEQLNYNPCEFLTVNRSWLIG
jgi:acetyltransferase-like isoleucine patch superfamily enzyme